MAEPLYRKKQRRYVGRDPDVALPDDEVTEEGGIKAVMAWNPITGKRDSLTRAFPANAAFTSNTWLPDKDLIGDYILVKATAAGGAGNVSITANAASAPAVAQVYELLEIEHLLLCGAGVANRTANLYITAGMRPFIGAPLPVTATKDWKKAGQIVTANQDASFFVPPAPGNVAVNANGTFTLSSDSPLPMIVFDTVVVTADVTNGQAGDTHNVAMLLRRVA